MYGIIRQNKLCYTAFDVVYTGFDVSANCECDFSIFYGIARGGGGGGGKGGEGSLTYHVNVMVITLQVHLVF